jgi:hypothetical protein
MRVSWFTISRILVVPVIFLCCTCASGPPAFGRPPHSSSATGVQDVSAGSRVQIVNTSSPDFTVQIAPSPLTVIYQFDGSDQEGQATGSASVTGTNGFDGQVNLTCSVAPPSFDEPLCFLFQNSLSVDASAPPSVTQLVVGTTSPNCVISLIGSRVVNSPGDSGWRGRMEMGTVLLALVICVAILPARRRAKIFRAGFIAVAALAMAGCGTSTLPTDPCGGGNFDTGTPPGTYMVTIAATSGNITHTTTVQLIVPPAD